MGVTADQQPPTHLEIRVTGALEPPVDALAEASELAPAPRSVTVLFSGAFDSRAVAATTDMFRRCRERDQSVSAEFVLDANADAHAALGRQPTSLGPILELSRALRLKGVPVRWWVPILRPIVYRLEALFSLAGDERIDAVLVPASLTPLGVEGPAAELDAEGRRFVCDFLACRLLGEEQQLLPPARAQFYQSVHDALNASGPAVHDQQERIVVLECDAHRAWRARYETRPALTFLREVDRAGAALAPQRVGPRGPHAVREVVGVCAEGTRALGQWAETMLARAVRLNRRPRADRPLRSVLAIGAYGGDHIGDAAIAGGVLLRMHRRYNTQHAILVSQRPAHTARLLAMLDIPVAVTVREYSQSTTAQLLNQVDGVVFAGGPLMDLPKQLVKHLYTVSRARRHGKPFVVEGIGVGPFIRRLSAWTARLLLVMADRLTVRTAADGRAPQVRGLKPVIDRDPAFDYLESRVPALTRMASADREWLERLFRDTEGRPTIAVNLRPLRPDYTAAASLATAAEYTRFVETRFEERLTEAMRRFHRASAAAPCFIFFPMNAIQFGSSDLRSAYRLRRLLHGDVDFRVWEADPSIDGVIALLRRVDAAITMRFHATIYAIAQQKPVIGIDYRPGTRDKVAALLSDQGKAAYCGRIDAITTEWIVERLSELTTTAGGAPRPHGIGENSPRRVQRPVPT